MADRHDEQELRDLRLRRLVTAADVAETTDRTVGIEDFVAASSGLRDDRRLIAGFRRRAPLLVASTLELLAGDAQLLTVGPANVVRLFADPHCEIEIGGELHLFRSFIVDDRVIVVAARVRVERYANGAVLDGEIVSVDDFDVTRDSDRLIETLRATAERVRFLPTSPRVRAALVIGRSAVGMAEQVPSVRATAAVHDVQLDVFDAPADPNDTRSWDQFVRLVSSGRYGVLFTVSDRTEKAVYRIGQRFATQAGRSHYPVLSADPQRAVSVTANLAQIAERFPERPTLVWGADAVQRIRAREAGDAFRLTPRAIDHLGRNAYPHVERMLEHVERLADMAEQWANFQGQVGGRVEDWARETFDLRIALHDRGIRDGVFTFEGVQLDNTPHVKVDDFAKANACGRIYFAFDGDPRWRFVVDHIGLHTRS